MNDREQLQQNDTAEPLQRSARLLVDAFSNGTHVWNDGAEVEEEAIEVQKKEEQPCEGFLKLPKAAPQLIMPAQWALSLRPVTFRLLIGQVTRIASRASQAVRGRRPPVSALRGHDGLRRLRQLSKSLAIFLLFLDLNWSIDVIIPHVGTVAKCVHEQPSRLSQFLHIIHGNHSRWAASLRQRLASTDNWY